MLEIDKQYTISEVAELTSYPPHVLRYYEKEFELEILRNESNHRYYTYIEIEKFQYIKSLQEKGFSNKQIKLIIQSPELLLGSENETALTEIDSNKTINSIELAEEISLTLREDFFDELFNELIDVLNNNNQNSTKTIEELRDEIVGLRDELNSKERDVLICENAKLKMKVKEKSYQTAELREQLKRIENKEGFFKRILKFNK